MSRKVKGRITHAGTGAGIPRARVVAWDSDINADDRMGSDTTDEDGKYSIKYPAKDYDASLGAEVRPDIYVKVFTRHVIRGWVLDKRSSIHNNHKKADDLTINLSIIPRPYAHMIWGRVVRDDGAPLRNARVVAWDDDTNTGDDYLGEAGTNENGDYLIDCTLYSSSGEPLGQENPDVYVNVHYVQGGQERIYRSFTSMNDSLINGVHINVTIDE